jgi:hypothetical protein
VTGFDARDWDLVSDIEPLTVGAGAPADETAPVAGTTGDGADSGSVTTAR